MNVIIPSKTSNETRKIVIPPSTSKNGLGNTKYICGTKERVCGNSNCGVIFAYFLIAIPTLAYMIIV